jgi:hypothetical protein
MQKATFLAAVTALAIIAGLFTPKAGSAEVNVTVTVPLPGFFLPAPPGLIVVPGTYVYYPPDVSVDLFFYRGKWYRPHRGGWYIAHSYNGPWRTIGPRHVPRALHNLPPAYRRVPPRHARVPYGDVQKNWRTWEHQRRWDRAPDRRYDRYGRSDNGASRGREQGNGRGRGQGRGGDS